VRKRLFAAGLFSLLLPTYSSGDVPLGILGIAENNRIRFALEETMYLPISELNQRRRVYDDPETGDRIGVEATEQNGSMYLMFIREEADGFPIDRAGNWIIKRDIESGEFVQAKVFLRDSPGTFVRLFPSGAGTTADLYLEGNVIHRAVQIRLAFDRVLVEPFARVMDLTRYQIDWSLFVGIGHRQSDQMIMNVSREASDRLPFLKDSDDGALDDDGTFRLIEDLTENLASGFNCSGFAKWIVDGVRFPVSGTLLSIDLMKQKHLEIRGHEWSEPLEPDRDPYFGLDWTRNLATAVFESVGREVSSPESADVRSVRFFEYAEDVGYRLDDLRTILYLLAIDRPGSLYLGSVNQAYGSAPVLRQHTHVVVLLPYFDPRGMFRVDVMERNVQTSLESLGSRYPGDFVHLVEVPVSGGFFPSLP